MQAHEIRRDPIENRLVILAPGRATRPNGNLRQTPPQVHPRASCAFCPARLDLEPSLLVIPDANDGWQVKVVANRFPAVDRMMPAAYGSHEVVVETPLPDRRFDQMSVREIKTILCVYAARVAALRSDRALRYVTVFKNVGELAGASVAHAHSQLLATGVVPPAVIGRHKRLEGARRRLGECPLCGVAASESKGPRAIAADGSVVAIAPYASAFPYEAWILTRAHRSTLTALTASELASAARLLRGIVRFLVRKKLAYNVTIDELFGATEMHFSIKVFPRGTTWAGVELANGMIVNPIFPERAAEEYRQSVRRASPVGRRVT